MGFSERIDPILNWTELICERQSGRTVSTRHNLMKRKGEPKREIESMSSAYQPNGLTAGPFRSTPWAVAEYLLQNCVATMAQKFTHHARTHARTHSRHTQTYTRARSQGHLRTIKLFQFVNPFSGKSKNQSLHKLM